MSIVIFGMRGTSESQGLPPRRNVKKEESEGRTENVEGGWCVWCVCAYVRVYRREWEMENWRGMEDVIEGADKVEVEVMEERKKGK